MGSQAHQQELNVRCYNSWRSAPSAGRMSLPSGKRRTQITNLGIKITSLYSHTLNITVEQKFLFASYHQLNLILIIYTEEWRQIYSNRLKKFFF